MDTKNTPAPPPHVERMKAEAKELVERTDKLIAFIGSTKFNELGSVQQNYLRLQLSGMTVYALALTARLGMAESYAGIDRNRAAATF